MSKSFSVSALLVCAWSFLHAQIWQSRVAGFSYTLHGGKVYAVNDTVVWTWGEEPDGFGGVTYKRNAISKSINAGNSWGSVTFPTQEDCYITSISALDDQRAWISLIEKPDSPEQENKLYKTTDGGSSWTPENVTLGSYPNFVKMWNEDVGIFVGDPTNDGLLLKRTIDGGQTWNDVENLPTFNINEYILGYLVESIGDKLWTVTTSGRILFTSNQGETWDIMESPFTEFYAAAFAVSDQEEMFLVFYDYTGQTEGDARLYRKNFNSGLWLNLSESNTNFYPYSIHAVPGSEVLVYTTYDWTREVWLTRLSHTGGITWMEMDSTTRVYWVDFHDPETGYGSQINWAGLSGSTRVYKYIGSPLTGLLKQTPLLHVDLHIAPNPIQDDAVISFESESIQDYWLMVHDLQGHLVFKKEYKGVSTISENINVKAWPNGMYTLTLSGFKGILTKKIVKTE